MRHTLASITSRPPATSCARERSMRAPGRTTSALTVTSPTGTGPKKSKAARAIRASCPAARGKSCSTVRASSDEGGAPCCSRGSQGPTVAEVARSRFAATVWKNAVGLTHQA